MEFEKVLNGIVKYINRVIMPTMNTWQQMAARIFMSRALRSGKEIKEALNENFFIKTFGFMSEGGRVDVEGLMQDIRNVFRDTPVVELNIPLYGTLKFNEKDVDELQKYIMEESA